MSEMEIIEDSTSNVVSNIPSSSGLSISVHPLVLLNISDHYTRTKLQNPRVIENGRMYGALLASQTGREVDIVNTFELPLSHADNNTTVLDKAFLTYKLDQLKQVFPQLDFMGWYSIGSVPTEADLQLHEQFLKINESSLFLQMNPILSNREFPIDIYESIIDIHQSRSVFVKSTYKTETEEAERIAVDHVAKPSSTSTTDTTSLGSTLIAHLTTQRNAIAMLNTRIQFLHQYLQDVKAGTVPVDHSILRQIASLSKRSPVLEKKAFEEQFTTEYNDVLLVAYLASITKGLNSINDLVDKFNLVNGNQNLASGGPSSGANKPISAAKKGRVRHHMSRG